MLRLSIFPSQTVLAPAAWITTAAASVSLKQPNAESFLSSIDATQLLLAAVYHRPNYNDSRTNPDGSPKYFFLGGVGFGIAHRRNSQLPQPRLGSAGRCCRNFNKKLGVDVQFDYDHFGFQTGTLNNLLAIYNGPPLFATDSNGDPLTQLGR